MLQTRSGGEDDAVLEYTFDENFHLSQISCNTNRSSEVVEYSFGQDGRFLKESSPNGSIQVEYS